jgi:hypothetical protein
MLRYKQETLHAGPEVRMVRIANIFLIARIVLIALIALIVRL